MKSALLLLLGACGTTPATFATPTPPAEVFAALSTGTFSAVSNPDLAPARAAAEAWLALVDARRWHEAYTSSARVMQDAMAEPAWTAAMSAVLEPLGPPGERTTLSVTPASSLPGAPDGAYVVFQFRTSFAHKADAVETITPQRGADGVWRVSGYFIR